MAGDGRKESIRRRRSEQGAKARGGTSCPLTNTAPIKQKRIISQMLPFPQEGLFLLPTAKYLFPLSSFPGVVLSLLTKTMMQSHPYPLRLGKG